HSGTEYDQFRREFAHDGCLQCANQLQRNQLDDDHHRRNHECNVHAGVADQYPHNGGRGYSPCGIHRRNRWVSGDSGCSELDLQYRVEHESAGGADEPSGDGGERASGVELEWVEWSDELQREALDDERGRVHDDRQSGDNELHGHGGNERDDVLLRSVGGEHGGAEYEFQSGECDAAAGDTPSADEPSGDGGERASGVELEWVEWSDELQRAAGDDERWRVHDDRQSGDGELHGHGVDERDDVLLRSVGGEHGGAEYEFQSGECDAAAGDTPSADEPSGDGGERASGVELECVEWGNELQREAVDDEWGSVHDDRQSDDGELYRHGSDERDDVLLRSVGGEHGGTECEFQSGECDTAAGSTADADEPGGDGGEWAGGVELECVEWGNELQREAVDDEWGSVHDDRQSDDGELYRHGSDERDDVLLRSVGGEHGGTECEFQSGECDTAAGSTADADEPGGDGGEWAGGVELECVEWGNELQREAVDDEWGNVHDDRQSDDGELYRHGSDERDDVLLRGVGGEHGGREGEFQ